MMGIDEFMEWHTADTKEWLSEKFEETHGRLPTECELDSAFDRYNEDQYENLIENYV